MSEIDTAQDKMFLQCECGHSDHLIEISIEDWTSPSGLRSDGCKLVIKPILTSRVSFSRRIPIAFRYIFGIRTTSSYHFDTYFISSDIDLEELEKLSRRVRLIAKVRRSIEAKNAKRHSTGTSHS
jgi:hypothetical protein